ncbi:hypothetical protein ABMA27_005397 [Loxostege sticticalis]|uniref:FP protein C-terminal domain-containing protein n=1 Tax=Loxostege sticticalis TaxID=481309 RepID=A0ABR3HJA6_LOXSC
MPLENLDKTHSEPNLSMADDDTHRDFVSMRNKRKRCDELSDLREEMKELFADWSERQNELFTNWSERQSEQLKKLFPILTNIQSANASIENSIAFLAEQNTEFNKRIEQLEIELKKKNEYIAIIEDRLEGVQRNSRKTCLEIKNVPTDAQVSRDELINMMSTLANTLNTNFKKDDIKDIYKTKGTSERKSVIVELNSTIARDEILKSAKTYNLRNKTNKLTAKHLGIKKSPDTPIFIGENLTPKASRLFFLARDLKKTKGYIFCWTSYGRVFVRKDEKSPIIQIHSEAQIQKLVSD